MEPNTEALPFLSQHDAVLFRVEQWQKDGDKLHFYSKPEFEQRKNNFDEMNIIYARRHPLDGLRGKNLEEVLKEVDGTKVGFTSLSHIDNMRPEFQAKLNIINPETAKKIRNNELAISTSLWYTAPDVGNLTRVSGDHVLLYDKSLGIPQGDAGALILNTLDTNEDKTTAYYASIEGFIGDEKIMVDKEPIKEVDPVTEYLKQNQATLIKTEATVIKQTEELAEKDRLIQNQMAEYKIISDKLEAIETEKLKNLQENTWNGFLEGTRTQFEARKGELGELKTALKLNQDMRDFEKTLNKPELTGAEGTQNLQNNQAKTDEEKEILETIATMKKIRSIVGR